MIETDAIMKYFQLKLSSFLHNRIVVLKTHPFHLMRIKHPTDDMHIESNV